MLAFQRCGCCKNVFRAVGLVSLVTRQMLGRGSRSSLSVPLCLFQGVEPKPKRSLVKLCILRNTGFELRISFSFSIWWGAVLDCGSCLKEVVGTPVFLGILGGNHCQPVDSAPFPRTPLLTS
jgi:hypothetical protein